MCVLVTIGSSFLSRVQHKSRRRDVDGFFSVKRKLRWVLVFPRESHSIGVKPRRCSCSRPCLSSQSECVGIRRIGRESHPYANCCGDHVIGAKTAFRGTPRRSPDMLKWSQNSMWKD
jgi:hypothetical protein